MSMAARFTIGRKIGTGFGLFILVVGIVFFLTNGTLNESREINRRINEVYTPGLRSLEILNNQLTRSTSLMRQWAFVQTREDQREKLEVVKICTYDIPRQLQHIDSISALWPEEDRQLFRQVDAGVNQLLGHFRAVRDYLPDFGSYQDPMRRGEAEFLFETGEAIPRDYDRVAAELAQLIGRQENYVNTESREMLSAFDTLRIYLGNISVFVIIAGILIAIFTSRSIVRPVNGLKSILFYMGRGIYPKQKMKISNDEIGDMAFALNRLVDGLERTREFAREVGKGRFETAYEPLSKEDELGHTLLKMRDDLAVTERELEQKVQERTDEVVRQKEEIERQRNKVTELYKDLTDSINYAKRLQNTILPTNEQVRQLFPESFVFYSPKDIVSGDFYWFKSAGSKRMFAAVDCTGHGVPGAFMSLVGYNVLNQVTKVYTQPATILNQLNRLSAEALQFSSAETEATRDGMDLAFCTVDSNTLMLEYAGAYNPLWILRNGSITELEPDKFAIGSFSYGEKEYSAKQFQLEPGDRIYVFSDGYADQFGGSKGKKFMKKRFREMILGIQEYSMEDQGKRLKESLDDWMGSLSQVDDILVIGVEV